MDPYIELYLIDSRLMLLKPSELPTDDMRRTRNLALSAVFKEIVEINARPGRNAAEIRL
jgi:hypothetical protein